VRRGEVWIRKRFGQDRKVVVIGADPFTARYSGVLVLPISDVFQPDLFEPTVTDASGDGLGVAQIRWLGSISKESLVDRAGVLTPASVEMLDMSPRVALSL
jgi:mRNA-degrading endonuclease toxin of MazEF toxin-antitoxin module